jgi:hypothetical protein
MGQAVKLSGIQADRLAQGLTDQWELYLPNILRTKVILHGSIFHNITWWVLQLQALQCGQYMNKGCNCAAPLPLHTFPLACRAEILAFPPPHYQPLPLKNLAKVLQVMLLNVPNILRQCSECMG